MKPVLAITMGDPGGVGPEIISKALNSKVVWDVCRPVVVGDLSALTHTRHNLPLGTHLSFKVVQSPSEETCSQVAVIDMANVQSGDIAAGRPTANAGHASVAYIKKAVSLVMSGAADAVVTAPINKTTLKMAGYGFPGHTELLAELTGASEYGMMLVGGGLRVMLTTIHCALKDVPGRINSPSVLRAIKLSVKACNDLGVERPRVAVAGLNPHAGEDGMFGDEEGLHIAPACEEAKAQGMDVTGPLPPDTLFFKALRGDFDVVVAMYHDQGLIPLKMLAFGNAVNITVGLPIIRTSVDHGTAYDIAGKGIADPASLIEAVKLAAQMAERKASNAP